MNLLVAVVWLSQGTPPVVGNWMQVIRTLQNHSPRPIPDSPLADELFLESEGSRAVTAQKTS
jgi:hypothetical protein